MGTQKYFALDELDGSDDELSRMPSKTSTGKIRPKYMQDDTVFLTTLQPCVAEFIGSIMLVSIGIMVVRTDCEMAIAIGHGFILTAIIVAFGEISGAHVNPAVTLGALISGGITPVLSLLYLISQMLGSIFGALFARGCISFTPGEIVHGMFGPGNATLFESITGGAPGLVTGIPLWPAVLTESFLTFILVLVILMSASRQDNSLAPVAIGLTLTACIIAGASSTGAALNPIRSFGPAIANIGLQSSWENHWVYWVGPLLGGGIAGTLHRLLLAPHGTRLLC